MFYIFSLIQGRIQEFMKGGGGVGAVWESKHLSPTMVGAEVRKM